MANSTINQIRKPYINLALTNPNPAVLDSISGYTENGMVVLSVSYKAGLQNWATYASERIRERCPHISTGKLL